MPVIKFNKKLMKPNCSCLHCSGEQKQTDLFEGLNKTEKEIVVKRLARRMIELNQRAYDYPYTVSNIKKQHKRRLKLLNGTILNISLSLFDIDVTIQELKQKEKKRYNKRIKLIKQSQNATN